MTTVEWFRKYVCGNLHRKIMPRLLIIIAAMTSTVSGFAQADITVYSFADARIMKDKMAIKRLSLADVVSEEKFVPVAVRDFRNLEVLILRPHPTRFGRPLGGGLCIVGYPKTKIASLPSWIGELRALSKVDLIGVTNFNYSRELKKLVDLPELSELSIDPDEFNDQLAETLVQFKKLKSLKIRATLTEEQQVILAKALPNCELVTGIYANY